MAVLLVFLSVFCLFVFALQHVKLKAGSTALPGTLRGVGLQHVGATVNIVAYYFIALPLGITLAFRTSMGLGGLWLGQVCDIFGFFQSKDSFPAISNQSSRDKTLVSSASHCFW